MNKYKNIGALRIVKIPSLLLTTYYLLFTTYYLLPTTYYLLPTTYSLLLTTYCPYQCIT
jgi:hypothetical protein